VVILWKVCGNLCDLVEHRSGDACFNFGSLGGWIRLTLCDGDTEDFSGCHRVLSRLYRYYFRVNILTHHVEAFFAIDPIVMRIRCRIYEHHLASLLEPKTLDLD